jgi:hypothetical protein
MMDFERYKSKKAPPKVASKRIPRSTELFARITVSQAEKLLGLNCMCWPLFTLLVFESLLARGKPFALPEDISDMTPGLSRANSRRALRQLEVHGLISIRRHTPKPSLITIL